MYECFHYKILYLLISLHHLITLLKIMIYTKMDFCPINHLTAKNKNDDDVGIFFCVATNNSIYLGNEQIIIAFIVNH